MLEKGIRELLDKDSEDDESLDRLQKLQCQIHNYCKAESEKEGEKLRLEKNIKEREAKIGTLSGDLFVLERTRQDLEVATNRLSSISQEYSKLQDFTQAERRLKVWDGMFEDLMRKVDEIRLKQSQRQFLVDCYKKVLGEIGFTGFTVAEDCQNTPSSAILTARLESGRTLCIQFPENAGEEVQYFPKDYPDCHSTVDQIEDIHGRLAEKGINMGQITSEPPLPPTTRKSVIPQKIQQLRTRGPITKKVTLIFIIHLGFKKWTTNFVGENTSSSMET